MALRDLALLVAVCFVWALNVVASKIVVDDLLVPPLIYAAARSLLVVVALSPWLLPVPRQAWRVMVAVFLLGSGSFGLMFIGLETTDPSTAGIVSLLSAPLTVVLGIFFLGERVRWRRATGIALAFAGVALALWSPSGLVLSGGVAFVALSCLAGAIGAILLKRLPVMSPLKLQAWSGLTGVLVLSPVSVAIERPDWAAGDYGLPLLGILLFSGLVVSVFAHTTYFRMLQKYEANLVASLTLMTPMFTIALGAAFTGDDIGVLTILGAIVAIAGVLIIAVRPSALIPKAYLTRRL